MEKKKIKLELRQSPLLLKIVVTVLILFSTAALVALSWVRQSVTGQTQALKSEAAALEQENKELQEKIDSLGTQESDKQIAREELGMVDPDTVVIQPQEKE